MGPRGTRASATGSAPHAPRRRQGRGLVSECTTWRLRSADRTCTTFRRMLCPWVRGSSDGQTPEASLELVAIRDDTHVVAGERLGLRRHAGRGQPPVALPRLRVAGMDERPVFPGVESRTVAQVRQVAPDPEHRLLRGVLGLVGIAQDRVGDPMEPRVQRARQGAESLPVPVLFPDHQSGVHASLACADTDPKGSPIGTAVTIHDSGWGPIVSSFRETPGVNSPIPTPRTSRERCVPPGPRAVLGCHHRIG
jgi:hypothetical protein